jgi:hypothetical protein
MLSLLASWGKLSKSPSILCIWNCSLRRHLTQHTKRGHSDIRPWTVEENRKLEELVKQGFKISRILSEMDGRTYGSIKNHLFELEYGPHPEERKKRRKWTAEELALLAEKQQQGLTARQIGQYFPDRTYTSIRTQWHCATSWPLTGPKRSRDFTDEQIQRVTDMKLKEAKKTRDIAKELRCTPRAIEVLWQDQRNKTVSQDMRDFIAWHKFWTPDEVKHLLELHRRGTLCIRDIVLQFPSKTLKAVYSKCLRERLKFPKPSQEAKDFGSHEDGDEMGAALSQN